MTKKIKNKKGFTLIELLIVILLIGVLSGVLLSVMNINGLRAKGRDAQRKSDLKKLQTALELYFNENRQYPATGVSNNEWYALSSAIPGLAPSYVSQLPTDPIYTVTYPGACSGTTFGYSYFSYGSGSQATNIKAKYIILAKMEVSTSASDSPCSSLSNFLVGFAGRDDCFADPLCYGVQNPF